MDDHAEMTADRREMIPGQREMIPDHRETADDRREMADDHREMTADRCETIPPHVFILSRQNCAAHNTPNPRAFSTASVLRLAPSF